jgi:hypothetical protein
MKREKTWLFLYQPIHTIFLLIFAIKYFLSLIVDKKYSLSHAIFSGVLFISL